MSLFLSLRTTTELVIIRRAFLNWAKENLADFIEKNFPQDISIRNGEVSSSEKQPFVRKISNGKFVFILDTTGKITSLDQEGILITKDKLITKFKNEEGEYETNEIVLWDMEDLEIKKGDLSKGEYLLISRKEGTTVLTYKTLQKWSLIFVSFVFPLMFLVLFVKYVILRTFLLFSSSLFSLFFNYLLKKELGYQSLVKIGLSCLVPYDTAKILGGVIFSWQNTFSLFYLIIYFLLYIAFLFLYIYSFKKEEKEIEKEKKI